MEPTTITILSGAGILIGGIVTGAITSKKIPFSRNGKKPTGCPDSACHDIVIVTAEKVEVLEKGQSKIVQKLDDMPQQVVTLLKTTKGLLK